MSEDLLGGKLAALLHGPFRRLASRVTALQARNGQ
jgi:hypothetical protein